MGTFTSTRYLVNVHIFAEDLEEIQQRVCSVIGMPSILCICPRCADMWALIDLVELNEREDYEKSYQAKMIRCRKHGGGSLLNAFPFAGVPYTKPQLTLYETKLALEDL